MKTHLEISNVLLEAAQAVASRDQTTVGALVEEGLRHVLNERKRPLAAKAAPKERQAGSFRLRRVAFQGQGLQQPIRDGSWEDIRDLLYEGRGS